MTIHTKKFSFPRLIYSLIALFTLTSTVSLEAQFIFNTYPDADFSTGFNIMLRSDRVIVETASAFLTPANGRVETTFEAEAIDMFPYTTTGRGLYYLSDDSQIETFVLPDGDETVLSWELLVPGQNDQTVLEIRLDAGVDGSTGTVKQFPDGDLYFTYAFGPETSSGSPVTEPRTVVQLKFDLENQEIIWEIENPTVNNVASASILEVEWADDSSFFTIRKEGSGGNPFYYISKFTPDGALVFDVLQSGPSRFPVILAPTTDGGVAWTANQTLEAVIKLNADGSGGGGNLFDNFFQRNTEAVTVTSGIGDNLLVMGNFLSGDNRLFSAILDNDLNIITTHVFDEFDEILFPRDAIAFDNLGYYVTGITGSNPISDKPFLLRLDLEGRPVMLETDNGEYCTAQSDFPFQEWVEDVTIGPLSNLGSGKFITFASAGYSDFTDLTSAPIDRGNPVAYTLDAGFSGINPGDYWTVFIDYNQNNVFDLPEEEVIRARGTSINGAFSIPADALNGTTRVRVILSKDGFSGPCENPAFGEVEDYTINIGGTTTPPYDLADLTLDDLRVINQAASNTLVDYSIDIINAGNARTGDFSLGVFLSRDDQLNSDDPLIGVIPTGNFAPGTLVENVDGIFDLTGVTPGDYVLIFKIDKDNVIPESQESNNIISRNFTVTGNINPGDLIDLELSMSATIPDPARFSRTRVTLTLTNNSTNLATNISTQLFLTPDNNFVFSGDGAVSFTGGGTFSLVSGTWSLPSLPGGATATISFDLFTLSDDFNPCAQVIGVDQDDVDSTPGSGNCPNAVEDDEANLDSVTPPVETIDLSIESLFIPTSGASGTTDLAVLFYNRTGNTVGNVPLDAEIFLSEDDQLDADDIPIGNQSDTSTGNVSNSMFTLGINLFDIPPGEYTMIVVLDRLNKVDEVNESNNIATMPFTVENGVTPPIEGVEIVVTLEVSDSSPEVFTKIFYQVTVVNEGTETATGLTIDFDYGAQEQPRRLALVNNPNPDYSDYRGVWDIGTLPAGAARTFELEVFVLPGASPVTTRTALIGSLDQADFNQNNNQAFSTIFLEASATVSEAAESSTASAKRPALTIDNLFPNPTVAEVTVAIQSQEDLGSVPLQIFDGFGKMVWSDKVSLNIGSNLISIPVERFSEGLYLVVLPTGSHQNLVKRFVKMR